MIGCVGKTGYIRSPNIINGLLVVLVFNWSLVFQKVFFDVG